MSDFVTIPFESDPDTLTDIAVESLRTNIPGWEPADGNLEVWMLAAFARIASEVTTVAAAVPAAVFRVFGQQLIGLPALDGEPATIQTIWTAQDTAGYTAVAGTQVAHRVSGDTLIVFEVTADVVIPPGSSSLSGIVLTAVGVGAGANGVPTGAMELIDALAWVSTIVATAVSVGGIDAETDAAYLDRLTAELRLLAPRPILPDDFAVLARRVEGVARALAVDGYDPVGPTTGNERMVCLIPLDVNGVACSSGVQTALQTYLDGLREASFVVNVTTPTSTTINVTYGVRVATGFDPTVVVAACTAAVTAYLSPAVWGGGGDSPPVWRPGEATVRYLALSAVIASVTGVSYVASLTINTTTADVALTGVGPLPAAGTITGASV